MYNPSEFCLTSVTCSFMCQECDWTIHEKRKHCAINRLCSVFLQKGGCNKQYERLQSNTNGFIFNVLNLEAGYTEVELREIHILFYHYYYYYLLEAHCIMGGVENVLPYHCSLILCSSMWRCSCLLIL